MSLSNASNSAEGTASGFTVGSQESTANTIPGNRFVDRRGSDSTGRGGSERRQFGSSHSGLSDAGRELAIAIDQYKIQHHRRYLTCDEMLRVLTRLGYTKQAEAIT
jgi:hypothetical protein